MGLLLRRGRLHDRILGHSGCVILNAPAGFGKSTLLSSLADELSVTVEETQSHRFLTRPDEGPRKQLIVAIADPDAVPKNLGPDALWIDHTELSFTDDEVTDLACQYFGFDFGHRLSQVLHPATGGWPWLVDMHLNSLANEARSDPQDLLRKAVATVASNAAVQKLLRPALSQLSDLQQVQLATLAFIGNLPEDLASEAISRTFISELRSLGIPVIRAPGGHVQVLNTAAQYLRTIHPPDQQLVRRIATGLETQGDAVHAARLLLQIDATRDAVDLLTRLRRRDLESYSAIDLLGLISLVSPLGYNSGHLKLQHARVLRIVGQLEDAKAVLAQALAVPIDNPSLSREISAELAFQKSSDGADAELLAQIECQLDEAPPTELITRVTLLNAKGLALAMSDDLRHIEESEFVLRLASRQWESLGETQLAVRALQILAGATLSELGRFSEIENVLDRATSLSQVLSSSRTVSVTILARISALAGYLETFSKYETELEVLASLHDGDWIKGYLQWSRMNAAAWRNDRNEVVRCFERAQVLIGALKSTRTEAVYLAESAAAFARVGDIVAAQANLAAAQIHPHRNSRLSLSEVTVLAAQGEEQAARHLVEAALAERGLSPATRWRVLLDLAWAAFVRDGFVERQQLHIVETEAAVFGEAHMPRLLYPQLWLNDDGDGPAALTALRVQVLDGFGVTAGDRRLPLSSGHATTLVKLLAVRGGHVNIEVAIDILWPDSDFDTGRRRLKNVLAKIRRELGATALLRTENSVAFGIDVSSDLNAFEQRALKSFMAVHSDASTAQALASEALASYPGTLLPDDLYDDWIVEARHFIGEKADSLAAIAGEGVPIELRTAVAKGVVGMREPF
jgi:ATP/maltotriose-dependent transcriptional regulator MalT